MFDQRIIYYIYYEYWLLCGICIECVCCIILSALKLKKYDNSFCVYIFIKMEVTGLKWVTYVGPSSCVTPASDPVLVSYAELLSQVRTYCMYVCGHLCICLYGTYMCSVCIRVCVHASVNTPVCIVCTYDIVCVRVHAHGCTTYAHT